MRLIEKEIELNQKLDKTDLKEIILIISKELIKMVRQFYP